MTVRSYIAGTLAALMIGTSAYGAAEKLTTVPKGDFQEQKVRSYHFSNLETRVGIPSPPTVYRGDSRQSLGFSLDRPQGDTLCLLGTYNLSGKDKESIELVHFYRSTQSENDFMALLGAALYDAHADEQPIAVTGVKMNGAFEVFRIDHPDFGTFWARDYFQPNGDKWTRVRPE